jgi:hypothetical protein
MEGLSREAVSEKAENPTVAASSTTGVRCPPRVFVVFLLHLQIYLTSTDVVKSGIFGFARAIRRLLVTMIGKIFRWR